MAGGGGGRSLEETSTWAVAVVCCVLLVISICLEFIIHLTDKWLTKRNRKALCEALEKIKSELMLLGFISLLLTVGAGPISEICIPKSVANTWLPCKKGKEAAAYKKETGDPGQRSLLAFFIADGDHRRVLAPDAPDKCAAKGKVSMVSTDGIHQLHIFIFVLAVLHVIYCIITFAVGALKMKQWKSWEMETKTSEYQFANDQERFRFARDTSFGRRHLSFWSRSRILLWMVCFVRQFVRSVPKVDYLTLRYGFIMAHLAPQSQVNFDFQQYIKRSLEEDFKVVVGISPPIWFFAVLFLLFNTHSSRSYLWLPFIPLIIILLVGAKLQVIITKMGVKIQERGEVVKGTPVVQPDDDLFWFKRPRVMLYLIHFVFFQNAFQLAFFLWSWYEYGFNSCFHKNKEDVIIRITMGVLVLALCSYVTLPLYALVTQMGSAMKPTIFDEKVAKALRTWHHGAKKNIKQKIHLGSVTPLSSQPSTPLHGTSPMHLLQYNEREFDCVPISPRMSNYQPEPQQAEVTIHFPHHLDSYGSYHNNDMGRRQTHVDGITQAQDEECSQTRNLQHEVDVQSAISLFEKNAKM